MKFTQIKETCLYSKDLKKSEQFYSEVLKLPKISSVEGRHVFFRAGSSVLLIFNPEVTAKETSLPPHYSSGKLHLAFEVKPEDYEASKQELSEKHNIKILQETTWKNGGKSFYFEDPDGNVLEIVEEGIWD